MYKLAKKRMRPIRDEVYDIIRNEILNGNYKPGDRLQEEQLAEQLGVSRTPVREALRKLEVDSLVVYYPHRGTVVSDIATDEVDELYAVREMLESFMIRRAAKNATESDIKRLRTLLDACEEANDPKVTVENVAAFNEALNALCHSESLIELDRRVREMLRRILVNNHMNPARRVSAHQEHTQIVDAVEAHDPDLAEKCLVQHLRNSPRILRR